MASYVAATEASEEAEARKHQVAERVNERRQSLCVDGSKNDLPHFQDEGQGLLLETREAREEMWKLLGVEVEKCELPALPALARKASGKGVKGLPMSNEASKAARAKPRAKIYAGGIPYM